MRVAVTAFFREASWCLCSRPSCRRQLPVGLGLRLPESRTAPRASVQLKIPAPATYVGRESAFWARLPQDSTRVAAARTSAAKPKTPNFFILELSVALGSPHGLVRTMDGLPVPPIVRLDENGSTCLLRARSARPGRKNIPIDWSKRGTVEPSSSPRVMNPGACLGLVEKGNRLAHGTCKR